jgi:hypothetical protein
MNLQVERAMPAMLLLQAFRGHGPLPQERRVA